jgi:hypothetical protein
MDKKILFIGDSWVTNLSFKQKSYSKSPIFHFWAEKGYSPHFIGAPSRDTQTILDIWTKYIPYLSDKDLIVIFLPVFNRTRLPKNKHMNLCVNKDFPRFNDYFVGSKSYNPKDNILEMWGNEFDWDYFNKKLEIQELINGSDSSILNYTEVIDSLHKMTPCKKIVHCWDFKKFDSDCIIYREEMTELVGMWDTIDDGHWSNDMNMEFMNFLFRYFNNETFKDTVPIRKNLI